MNRQKFFRSLRKKTDRHVICDVDGVVRNLNTVVKKVCETDSEWGVYEDFSRVLRANPKYLSDSPPYQYVVDVINEFFNHIIFFTVQERDLEHYTIQFLNKHITVPYDVVFFRNGENKLDALNTSSILIEDSPNFDDFSQIWLADKPYNKDINCKRFHNKDTLLSLLYSRVDFSNVKIQDVYFYMHNKERVS